VKSARRDTENAREIPGSLAGKCQGPVLRALTPQSDPTLPYLEYNGGRLLCRESRGPVFLRNVRSILPIYLRVMCLSVPAPPSSGPSVLPTIFQSIYISICLSACLPVCLLVCSACPSVHPSFVCLSFLLSVALSPHANYTD
jgi:hypothetical protein